MNGIILINKPTGITSHDVVSKIKRITNEKVGHAGTLDPLAEGLLVVLIGEATKISRFLLNDDKSYKGVAVLGEKTDSYDKEGNILEKIDASRVNKEDIVNTFSKYTGEYMQCPPQHSAVKINGKKSYELARKGIKVNLKKRKVRIKHLEVLSVNSKKQKEVKFRTKVSKGTYVRSLINDIGDSIGVGAYLKELVRTSSGDLNINNSILLDKISSREDIKSNIVPIINVLNFKKIIINNELKKKVINGQRLSEKYLEKLKRDEIVVIIDNKKRLLGMQKKVNDDFNIEAVFNNENC